MPFFASLSRALLILQPFMSIFYHSFMEKTEPTFLEKLWLFVKGSGIVFT